MFKFSAALLTACVTLLLTASPLTVDPIIPTPHITPAVSRGTTVKTITVQATAYTHTGNKTATGTWPKAGRTIAVDTATIPLGSRVFIQGIGYRVAEDKLPPESIRKGAKIDIFINHTKDCLEFGRQDVVVEIKK